MDNDQKQTELRPEYEKPELGQISFKQLLVGDSSCIGLPETGEGGCEEDLFTPEYEE